MADEIENFLEGGASAGASETYPAQCSSLRKNGHVVIKGRPCKIVDMSTSKTGKHGHAKVHLIAIDIFTGRKLEDICPSTHNMDVPNVKRYDYNLLDISDDDFLTLMDPDDAETRSDLKCPENEIGQQIRAAFEGEQEIMVTVLKAMGEETPIAIKNATK